MLVLFAPGTPREKFFTELIEIRQGGRELSQDELAEFYAGHDQYVVPSRAVSVARLLRADMSPRRLRTIPQRVVSLYRDDHAWAIRDHERTTPGPA